MLSPKPPRNRASAEQVAVRRIRVVGFLQSGLSYEEIASLESISRRRVRQIVVEAQKAREEDAPADRRFHYELMLAPALRLAARGINEGKLEAIDRLVKVIDRLEKFRPPTQRGLYDDNARERLLAKLKCNYDRITGPQSDPPEESLEAAANH